MNLIFLGTSAGTPTKQRNVSAIALCDENGKNWYLVDCGEATQHQILKTRLSLNSLKAILITHVHGDHCYGLPGILASAGLNGRQTPLVIIAPKAIKIWLEVTLEQTQLSLPFELNFIDSENLPQTHVDNIMIETTEVSHRVACFAYSFVERSVKANLDIEKLTRDGIPKGPLWQKIHQRINVEVNGTIINSDDYLKTENTPRKIVISGDNDTPSLLTEFCQNCDVLVHEATYSKQIAEKAGDRGHSYAELVGEFAELTSVPNLVLTHFSSRYRLNSKAPDSITALYDEAKNVYSGRLFMANDFAEYKLDRAGKLIELET